MILADNGKEMVRGQDVIDVSPRVANGVLSSGKTANTPGINASGFKQINHKVSDATVNQQSKLLKEKGTTRALNQIVL